MILINIAPDFEYIFCVPYIVNLIIIHFIIKIMRTHYANITFIVTTIMIENILPSFDTVKIHISYTNTSISLTSVIQTNFFKSISC